MTNGISKVRSGLRALAFALALLLASPSLPALADGAPSYAEQAEQIYDDGIEKAYGDQTKFRTPAELTQILDASFQKLDKLLNQTWKETRRYLKNADPQLFDQLLADQRAWLKFAENFCTAVYGGFGGGGSMYRSMGVDAQMSLWKQRIIYLDTVLRYVSEVHGAPEN